MGKLKYKLEKENVKILPYFCNRGDRTPAAASGETFLTKLRLLCGASGVTVRMGPNGCSEGASPEDTEGPKPGPLAPPAALSS